MKLYHGWSLNFMVSFMTTLYALRNIKKKIFRFIQFVYIIFKQNYNPSTTSPIIIITPWLFIFRLFFIFTINNCDLFWSFYFILFMSIYSELSLCTLDYWIFIKCIDNHSSISSTCMIFYPQMKSNNYRH